MEKEKEIQQPDDMLQAKLNELLDAKPEKVEFNGSVRKIGWMHPGTRRKFSDVMASEKDPHKTTAKLAAVILLNGIWKIRFFYWIVWRWYHYVKDIDETEVLKLVVVAKKKVQQDAFYLITMLSTEMTDLMMTMTRKEVSRIQAAQRGVQPTA